MNNLNPSSAPDLSTSVHEVTPYQLARIRPLPLIIDIRSEEEFAHGHIAGARHISSDVLEHKIHDVALDLDTPLAVYCAIGNRSILAAERLRKIGFRTILFLKGGLRNWLEAGGLLEVPTDAPRSLAGIW